MKASDLERENGEGIKGEGMGSGKSEWGIDKR